jgi:hypothetical protein
MAKPKPSLQGGVIRHEIVLGKVEREMAEHLAFTKSINNLMWPIVGAGATVVGYYGVRAFAEWAGGLGDWLTGPEYVQKGDEQVKNPLHDVPVVGGLFAKGMSLGPEPAKPIEKGSFWDVIFSINPNWRNRPTRPA